MNYSNKKEIFIMSFQALKRNKIQIHNPCKSTTQTEKIKQNRNKI